MTSPDIENGGKFSNDHIKDGGNLPPQLDWTDPPDGTQSFALMIEDLDALSAPAFRHWGGVRHSEGSSPPGTRPIFECQHRKPASRDTRGCAGRRS
ncbi:hypothetical protein HFO26_29105 [Rhizobium leguminosarum]|uniref:hypothetical protein n=1 Tax=Rhizobium leguminosarum TaxID=384 RepID=UPI001C940779|nr:hypothetical protein [Rhizobium leguminosarum]